MKLEEFKKNLKWKGLKSIEFRGLRFIFRLALALAFLSYLATDATGAWSWVQIKWVRTQDLSRLEDVVSAGVAAGDLSGAERWIAYRPLSESAEIFRRAEPLSGNFSPLVFFNFAKRSARLGDVEQKRFWVMLGRYRLRYDALRCGAPDSVDLVKQLVDIVAVLDKDFIEDLPRADAVRLTRRVLDFDAKYPAADNPENLCWLLARLARSSAGRPQPKESWEGIRFSLRYGTDISLRKAEEELKKEKK